VTELLGRTLPDGNGDSFYNIDPPAGTTIVWAKLLGSWLDAGDRSGMPGFRTEAGGLEAGGDIAVGQGGRLGAAIGYEAIGLSDSADGSASQDILRVSLYGSHGLGPIGLSAVLSYAHGWDRTSRESGFGDSTASLGGDEYTAAVQAAAPFVAQGLAVTPAVGLLVSSLNSSVFQEHNGANAAFAVSGPGTSTTLVSPYAVLGLSHAFTTARGAVVTPDLQLGYRYDAAADNGRGALIALDGTVFRSAGLALNPSSALVGASVTAHSGAWSGFVRYRATLSSNWTNQSVEAGFRWVF
jgi:outer membrane autotransporter protein